MAGCKKKKQEGRPDHTIVAGSCYTPVYLGGAVVPNTSIIVQLENNSTLALEKRNCDCACNLPYSFSAARITYVRE
jgi:hypothetical protein